MPRIIRTASAESDALTIAEYIRGDNPDAAVRWLEELDETLDRLARFPMMGERVEQFGRELRRHCLGNYLLFYVPIDDGTQFRLVLHGARKIEELL